MTRTPSKTERRHRTAIRRSARIGGHLARVVKNAARTAIAGIPDRPGPHDLARMTLHVAGVVNQMTRVLGERFRGLLLDAARREHLLSAVQLTRAWNGRRRTEGSARLRGSDDSGDGLDCGRGRGGVRVRTGAVITEGWRDYLRLIVPAPALDFLESIVGPLWRRVVGAINPERAGNVVLQGVAQGKDRRVIAKELTEVFDGYEGAARRVARTAGLQVATQTQLAVSESIPELVVGYELNTVLDDRVRPEHRKRHGWRYYRNPVGNQRPLSDCPQPPIWDGKVHFNCRCFLSPILQIDGEEV